jgi:hypothetical protein
MYRKFAPDPVVRMPVKSSDNSDLRFVLRRAGLALMALLLLQSVIAQGQATSPKKIIGDWVALDRTLKLEMFRANSDYEARMLYGSKLVESDGATFKVME